MKRSITSRIRKTKTGKMVRRKMGLGHNKAKRSGVQKIRKAQTRTVHSSDKAAFAKYKV